MRKQHLQIKVEVTNGTKAWELWEETQKDDGAVSWAKTLELAELQRLDPARSSA